MKYLRVFFYLGLLSSCLLGFSGQKEPSPQLGSPDNTMEFASSPRTSVDDLLSSNNINSLLDSCHQKAAELGVRATFVMTDSKASMVSISNEQIGNPKAVPLAYARAAVSSVYKIPSEAISMENATIFKNSAFLMFKGVSASEIIRPGGYILRAPNGDAIGAIGVSCSLDTPNAKVASSQEAERLLGTYFVDSFQQRIVLAR